MGRQVQDVRQPCRCRRRGVHLVLVRGRERHDGRQEGEQL